MKTRFRSFYISVLAGLFSAAAPYGVATSVAQQSSTLGGRSALPDAVDLQKPQKPAFENDADSPPPLRRKRDRIQDPELRPSSGEQFIPRAALTTAAIYDDNIYARSTNKIGDQIFVVRPELGFDYRNEKYLGSLNAALEHRTFARNSGENNLNWSVNHAGTFLPQPDLQVQTRLGALQGHEQRGAADSQLFAFDNPFAYRQYDAALAVNKRFDGWWTSVGGAGSLIQYDTPTITGIPIDQAYRNGVISVETGRVGKVVAPLTSAFVEVSANQRNFRLDGFDSQGFRVVGGAMFEPGAGARVRGEVFAGYMRQNYNSFVDFSTWTYGGAMAFRVAPKTIAVIDGKREAKESALAGGVSVLESSVNARIDYQFTEKFMAGAGASYLNQLYKMTPDRIDTSWGPLLSAKYFFTPNITLGLDYRYIGFSSDSSGVSRYNRNLVLLTLSGKL